MRKRKPNQKTPDHPFHDFEYDPLKGYEIPENPYTEEIAQEMEIDNDEQVEQTIDQEQPYIQLDESRPLTFDE